MSTWTLAIGAQPDEHGTRFRVWAASAQHVEVVIYDATTSTPHTLAQEADGYFSIYLSGVLAGARYMYRLDGGDPRPDPASRFQPEGVHGPSHVVDLAAFPWADQDWRGIALDDAIIYELHIGTFTLEGTFDAAIARLDDLRALGVTALEILPVADFPGERNWGYDGVALFAPSRAYGGPDGLRRLVDAAHARGLAVLLDAVYNHLGPDGNYLSQFSARYFTAHHKTPWGNALNFDTPGSAQVRDFFVANACYWAHEYHIDGLRLDATHELKDDSTPHILAEIASRVHESLPADRHFLISAEDERNDVMLVRDQRSSVRRQAAGYGLDALWADDFHHQLRVAFAGEHESYFADFSGTPADIAATLRQGWFYIGQMSSFGGRPRGTPTDDVPLTRFIQCIQNHDQVGNRALGERLNHDIVPEAYRAASALLLLTPSTPLLWMGQEWAASTPFQFFTDHNAELGRLVTEGRRREFAHFAGFSGETVPDPQARATFERSKLRWDERDAPKHAGILQLYRDLIALRRSQPALRERRRSHVAAAPISAHTLAVRRTTDDPRETLLVLVNIQGAFDLNIGAQPETAPPAGQRWATLLDTEAAQYGGAGAAQFDAARLAFSGPRAVVLGCRAATDEHSTTSDERR